MAVYQRLTDRVIASGVTKNDLIHIVITGDTTQDPAGSSYKATIEQVFDSITGYCISDLYVTNIHGCSPVKIWDDTHFLSTQILQTTSASTYTAFTSTYDGITTIFNDNSPVIHSTFNLSNGNKSYSGFFAGNDPLDGTRGVFFSYVGTGYTRTSLPPTGVNFWRNKALIRGNSGIDGLVINPVGGDNSATIWFEINGSSTTKLKGDGNPNSVGLFGLGLNPDGTEDPTATLQVGGTGTTGTAVINGTLKSTTISATTYQNLPPLTGNYLPLSGGTVFGNTIFTGGLTANTLTVTGLTQTKGITSTGGITFPQRTVNTNYTATTNDYMIDITGGTFNVQLPTAIGIQGKLYSIKNNGGGAVTVLPYGSEKIDDKPFIILSETNAIQVVSNGLQFIILGQDRSTVNNSTGVFEFSGLSKVSATQFSVSEVKGWIVDDTTNPLSPQIYYVNYTGGTHTDSYVTTAFETFVYLTSGGTIGQQDIPLTEQQRRQNIFLGKLGHPEKTSINLVFSQPDVVLSPLAQLRDMFTPINLINGGVYPSANGANLKINTSAGYIYGLGINFTNNSLSPNALSISGTSPCTFQYRTQTGGTVTNVTDIDPLYYDVAGVKTAIGGTKATNQRIYLLQNGTFRVQYGQTTYNTLALAIEALQTETFTPFPNYINNAVLIGILTVLSTATDLSDTSKARFFFASKFGESVGAAGGIATTNLQQAYNNSSEPEITINSTLDGISIKNGTGNADNVTKLLEGVDTAGLTTSFIRADGAISATTISATTFTGTSTTMSGTKGTTVTDGSTGTAFLTFSGSNTVGGVSYNDFIRVTNTSVGATNPNKTFRTNITGEFEIINSAYSSNIFTLGDTGNLTIPGRMKSSINYSQTGGGASVTLGASVTPQTILSTSITTYGNPVVVCAYGDAENTGAGYWVTMQLYRDSTAIGAIVHAEGSAGSENSPFAFNYIDNPAAGTYTYYLKANIVSGGNIKFGESTAPILNVREL